MKWFPEVPDCWKSKPGKVCGPCHYFDVSFVGKPNPKAEKAEKVEKVEKAEKRDE